MEIFIALLRGINVGGRNSLPMKELTLILEENSCHKVKTYIQSGNVVFESIKAPENIDLIIEEKFGFKPEIIFIKKNSFLTFSNNNPFNSNVGKEIHLYFCKEAPRPNLDNIKKIKLESEQYFIKDKVFYLYAPGGIGRSKLVANLEKLLGVPATGRNLNTVNKIIEMMKKI